MEMKSINRDKIKFIAMDMDGTILNEGYQLSARVSSTLNLLQKNGKKLIIATGRILSASRSFLQGAFEPDAFVCTNGADIYGPQNVRIASHHIPCAALPSLIALSRREKTFFCSYVGDQWLFEQPSPMVDFYEKRSGIRGIQRDFDSLSEEDVLKFLAIGSHEDLIEIRKEISMSIGALVDTVFSHDTMLEIIAKGVSKKNGLKECLRYFGGSLDEVVAFGDAENDLEMLKSVKIGVAMGNASPSIHAEVDYIAPSVDDDGVARFLEDFFEV
jgi:Cof subfamily protein (haloacid dehalogenase superfamily)